MERIRPGGPGRFYAVDAFIKSKLSSPTAPNFPLERKNSNALKGDFHQHAEPPNVPSARVGLFFSGQEGRSCTHFPSSEVPV